MKFLTVVFLIVIGTVLPCRAWATTVLVVGDSISAAYGIPVDQGWVSLLEKRLQQINVQHRVVNASISGDTTAGGRARLPQALQRYQPDVVVLQLGGNDGLRALPLKEMRQNLEAMVLEARKQNARVLLIGIQLPPNYGPAYTQGFAAVYRELARRRDVALVPSLVDGIGTEAHLMQGDGIHPNAQAQSLMLERVWLQLRSLI